MTVGEAIAWVGARLQAAGLSEPQREAQALVAACLGWERARLAAHPEARLSALQAHRLERWARRRAQREPLAYLTRRAWFYGLELTVGRGALIPRPETELLVEVFLGWARGSLTPDPSPTQWERGANFPLARFAGEGDTGGEGNGSPVLVDVGTGTGAIALACLRHALHWLGIGD
jgi:methylase of polypeptide subunit release factors